MGGSDSGGGEGGSGGRDGGDGLADGRAVREATAAPDPPRVLVLGGTGFIGRQVVVALLARGARPIVGSRHPRRRAARLPDASAWREAHFERLLAPQDWQALLEGCDGVINCVGILRQRWGETYDRVHHRAPGALAVACAARGLRLVHVSALGLEGPARSRFLISKRAGEAAVRAAGGDWHIVRPSLLDGEGGYGARWMRRAARWPVHPLPRGAVGRIAALDVGDLGEAIATLALAAPGHPAVDVREHELGGQQILSLRDYLAALRLAAGHCRAAPVLPIPDALTRLTAHLCDLLHATPFSFGHWELLQRDNLPHPNRLIGLLARPVKALGLQTAPAAVDAEAATASTATASW